MRLFALAAAVPLLMASATLARSPLRRGETTDTCANLNANLAFPDVEVDGEPSRPLSPPPSSNPIQANHMLPVTSTSVSVSRA